MRLCDGEKHKVEDEREREREKERENRRKTVMEGRREKRRESERVRKRGREGGREERERRALPFSLYISMKEHLTFHCRPTTLSRRIKSNMC
jgi:hypothetical protein